MDGDLCWKMFKIIQLLDSGNKELEATLRTSITLLCFQTLVFAFVPHLTDIWAHLFSKTPRKATGKTRTACCGGPENLLESSSLQRVIWVWGSLRQTRLNELLPNPKQSYNLLGFLLDLTQAQGSCKKSVLHTRSASCLFCPQTGKHL